MSSPEKPTTNTTITVARQHLGAGFRRDTAAPPPPSVSDNHISRIIPVVLLAALSVLAVSVIIYEAPPASAYHGQVTEVWSGTVTVPTTGSTLCNNVGGAQLACSSTSVLTDDDFTYAGVDYTFRFISVSSGTFSVVLDKATPAAIRSTGTFYVDGSPFKFADAAFQNSYKTAQWPNINLSWTAGDTVQLRLTAPELQPCEMLPAGYQILLGGYLDAADGAICSNSDQYQLGVTLRDSNGRLATHTSDVCVLLERVSGSAIAAEKLGLPGEGYIKAGYSDIIFAKNVDATDLLDIRDGGPVVIGARTGSQLSTFTLTVVDGNADSCPAPSSTTTRTTPGTPGTTPGGSTPTTSGGASSFVPFSGDATRPTILSMNIAGNATRTLGDGGPLLFNITFSEQVTGVDPTDFVLVSGNDTIPVSANATSINATIHPNQVIPYDDTTEFVIEMEPDAAYDGAAISGGTARFDIEHLGSHLLEVRLTAPDCRSILVHNQTFQFRPDLAKPRTIEPLAGSPVAGPWTLGIRDHALYQNATVHLFGLTLDVGPAITVNGTGSSYQVAVNAATTGNLTLGLADDHDITDISGNRLAGGIPAGINGTYVLAEPPRRTCP